MSDALFFPTGYSKQCKDLIKYLQNTGDYEVIHFSWGYRGKPLKSFETSDGSWSFKDIIILPSGNHQFGGDYLPKYIQAYKPNITLLICDSFMIPYVTSMTFSPSISMFWFPSDGGFFPKDCWNIIKKFDVPVAFTKYAQKQLSDEHNIVTEQIWEGVDPTIYHELKNVDELKMKWSSRCKNCNGQTLDLRKFKILLCNSRNQGRKMLPENVKAFSKLLKLREDVVLLFNADPEDPAQVNDLRSVAKLYGCDDRVLFTDMNSYIEGLSDAEINELYNMMDVFFLLTSGEGYGLTFVESAMVGKCVITTDYTNAKEILPNQSEKFFIPLAYELMGTYEVNRALADIDKAAEYTNEILNNPDELVRIGKLNHEWCMENVRVDLIGKQWDCLIKKKLGWKN